MVETLIPNKATNFEDSPSVYENYQNEEDLTTEPSTVTQDDFCYTQAEPYRTRRRGRPRIYPYNYEKYAHFSSALDLYKSQSLKHPDTYNSNNDVPASPVEYKEKDAESYTCEDNNYDDLINAFKEEKEIENNLKYKNETDTRLTSCSDVLSNFNYETIDNYEVSDNYETIDNYTTSQDYTTSINDNCEFPLKSNDSEFNLDETNLENTTSHPFNSCNEDEFTVAPEDDAPDKDQEDLSSTSKDDETSVEKNETVSEFTGELETSKLPEQDFSEKKGMDSENMFVISDELRQSYIRQSKLLPKIRGVWFNSTVRRMGWVGQAYKKCKRIEKIFSINKHGFEGARKLAIAFRNSQKPNNKTEVMSYPDVSLKDVIKPISQLRMNLTKQKDLTNTTTNNNTNKENKTSTVNEYSKENLRNNYRTSNNTIGSSSNRDNKDKDNENNYYKEGDKVKEDKEWVSETINLKSPNNEEKEIDDSAYPVDYRKIIEKYKSSFNNEEKIIRDNTCREALLFMLYELAALVELDFPVPPMSKVDCKRGINYHINFLENSKKSTDMLPYINSLAHYICKGITPTDMAHFELYSLIHTLSHCQPLKMEFTT